MKNISDKPLLTLLAELLPMSGGWPEDVVAMVQSGDGRVLFCGEGYSVQFNELNDSWLAASSAKWGEGCCNFGSQIHSGIPLAIDYKTAVVTSGAFFGEIKKLGWSGISTGIQPVADDAVVEVIYDSRQYEKMPAYRIWWPGVDFWREVKPEKVEQAEPEEWEGTGYPKAGQRCMVKIGKGTYEPCEILYSDKAVGVSFRYLKEGYPHSIDCVSAKAAKDYFHPFNGTEPRMMVWDGKGKPPVGVPIEMKHKRAKADWAKPGFNVATLSYVGREVFIHDTGSHELFGALDDYEFRPHETEEDKAARIKGEAIDILAEVAGGLTGADEVYRMIEAGLVPGIKIDK